MSPLPLFYPGDRGATFSEDRGATFTEDRRFRYRWWDQWERVPPNADLADRWTCLFVMLNPSTADEVVYDPTLRRCRHFAASFGGLAVVNLFAFRSTNPKALDPAIHVEHAPGENDRHIVEMAAKAGRVVCAWGQDKAAKHRETHVLQLLAGHREVGYLPHPRTRKPAHPLYLPNYTGFVRFDGKDI